MAEPHPVRPSPILTGLTGRCPACGKGRLFSGYLKFNPACPECGQDFTGFDTADGPAFFVGFLVLIVFAPIYFLMPMLDMPGWAMAIGYMVLIAACIGFCLALLPPFKGVLANLQLHHRAEEARFEDRDKG